MARKLGLGGIILIIYLAIFLISYVVLPYVFHRGNLLGGYFPYFFFFPFFFGRRGFRTGKSRQKTGSNSPGGTHDDLMDVNYDPKEWEKYKTENYDEFGIKVKNDLSRYWYYIGMAVILAAAIVILLLKGTLAGF